MVEAANRRPEPPMTTELSASALPELPVLPLRDVATFTLADGQSIDVSAKA